ncbi:hypothetical protein Hanom_Chr09g00778261 [Helianthus anomalus]
MIEFLQLYENCRLLLMIGMKQKLVTSYQPHLLVKCCRYADTFHAHIVTKIMFNFPELLL